jgi:predicted secreted hydrolase
MPRLSRFLSACLLAAALFAAAPSFRQALPGYRYQFPRDRFNHPDFRTEWWYYTGNLQTGNGHRYGFELVFFRQAEQRPSPSDPDFNPSIWRIDDLYLAHLPISSSPRSPSGPAPPLTRAIPSGGAFAFPG